MKLTYKFFIIYFAFIIAIVIILTLFMIILNNSRDMGNNTIEVLDINKNNYNRLENMLTLFELVERANITLISSLFLDDMEKLKYLRDEFFTLNVQSKKIILNFEEDTEFYKKLDNALFNYVMSGIRNSNIIEGIVYRKTLLVDMENLWKYRQAKKIELQAIYKTNIDNSVEVQIENLYDLGINQLTILWDKYIKEYNISDSEINIIVAKLLSEIYNYENLWLETKAYLSDIREKIEKVQLKQILEIIIEKLEKHIELKEEINELEELQEMISEKNFSIQREIDKRNMEFQKYFVNEYLYSVQKLSSIIKEEIEISKILLNKILISSKSTVLKNDYKISQMIYTSIAITLTILIVVFIFNYILSSSLARSINEVTYLSKKLIKKERFEIPELKKSKKRGGFDEISQLYNSFILLTRSLNYIDYLTQAYSRSFFEEELTKLNNTNQLPISIIIGDVSGLKLTNDAFGHDKGDELLIKIAKIIKSEIRVEDIFARIGGDEFGIIMQNTPPNRAQEICNRIKSKCYEYKDFIIPITISLGYDTKTSTGKKLSDVLKMADENMYKQKMIENSGFQMNVLSNIMNTLNANDIESKKHILRLKKIGEEFANHLELKAIEKEQLILLCEYHDIGKIATDKNILLKKEVLDKKEWEEIKKHTESGYRLSRRLERLSIISELILTHHENYDGTGYTLKLSKESIPYISRIFRIIESFERMLFNDLYRPCYEYKAAIEELKKHASTYYDPQIIEKFIELANNPYIYTKILN